MTDDELKREASTPEETRAERRRLEANQWNWIARELILYRGLALFLLIINAGTTITTYFIDQNRHDAEAQLRLEERNADNKDRATHWARLETAVADNGREIGQVDTGLRACLVCHAHPNLDEIIAGFKRAPTKK